MKLKLVCFFCGIFIILFLFVFIFRDIAKIDWSIIDDHEIMYYVGRTDKLNFFTAIERFKTTEAFLPGKSSRYRPAYYFLRFAEMTMWGKNVLEWHLFRVIMLFMLMFFIFLFLSKILNTVFGVLFVMFSLNFKFWQQITVDLGPAETYIVFASILILVGLILVFSKKLTALSASLISLGSIIAVGSKENLLYIWPFYMILFLYILFKSNSLTKIYVAFIFVSTFLFFSIVAYSVAKIPSITGGVDIYQNSMRFGDRFHIFISSIENLYTNKLFLVGFTMPIVFLVIFLCYALYYRVFLSKQLFWPTILVLFLFATYTSQYVFYNGNWPTNIRYDYPGIFLISFTWILFVYVLSKRFVFLTTISTFILFLLLLFSYKSGGFYSSLRSYVDVKVSSSKVFSEKLRELFSLATKTNPKCRIAFYTNNPWDYEPAISISRYIYSAGFDFQYVIYPSFCSTLKKGDMKDKMIEYLSEEFCKISMNGQQNNHIGPLKNSDNNMCCLSFAEKGGERCQYLLNINGSI